MEHPLQNAEKCGGIIISPDMTRVLCVLNRQSFEKGEKKWGFPKGHRSPGEDVSGCARREIYEETSLKFDHKRLDRSCIIHNNVYFVIRVEFDYDTLCSTDLNEICKVEWKTLEELRTMNLNRDLKQFVEFTRGGSFQSCIPYKGIHMHIRRKYRKSCRNSRPPITSRHMSHSASRDTTWRTCHRSGLLTT